MSGSQLALLGGPFGPPPAYQIQRSLRFNSADSAYLTRTFPSAGNKTKWTWSCWIKRSVISTDQGILSAGITLSQYWLMQWLSDNTIQIDQYNSPGGADFALATTAVYRDVSAWYHLVLAVDTSLATAADRMKIYINNVQQTTTAVTNYIGQNKETLVNSANAHEIGRRNYNPDGYHNGYMTEINFVNDQALTPSSFGETNADTGVWQPKQFTGTYGTTGFYLNFSDNSGTTSTTLGKDYSGNSNNFTPNNFSVTAGVGNDSLVDSPTAYGSDTGAGGEVRGNYCTLNPLDTGTVTLANGNLDVTFGSIARGTRATFGVSTGKYYFEMTVGTFGSQGPAVGVAYANANITTNYAGSDANAWVYNGGDGKIYNNNSGTGSNATYTTNDVIGVAINMDSGTVTFYKNGSAQPSTVTGLSGTVFPVVTSGGTAGVQHLNFGQRPFAYTAPSGFKALCTQNLPTPTIGATSTTQAGKYFNTVLYTGNGSTQTVSGVGFQPDLVWNKQRSSSVGSNWLNDAVRTAGYSLSSNRTDAEADFRSYFTAFNSDGFGLAGGTDGFNANAATYVAWNWKANGAGSTNTSGTISSTVSVNTTAGFSIVTYTGNGTNGATVGHGLGVSPNMVIIKNRTTAIEWPVYHSSLGAGYILFLDITNGQGLISGSSSGGVSAVSSTTFTCTQGVTNINNVNKNTDNYVAYCFASVAGYSAFGSYTGNGSSDGPFVYTGFRPALVLVKVYSTAGYDWYLMDDKRPGYNAISNRLLPNLSNAEITSGDPQLDIVSNGFKLRTGNSNASSVSYIYMALAANPFKYSLAR